MNGWSQKIELLAEAGELEELMLKDSFMCVLKRAGWSGSGSWSIVTTVNLVPIHLDDYQQSVRMER